MGTWAFRVIAQEVFYQMGYTILFCSMIPALILIALASIIAVFDWLYKQTNSYIPQIIGIPVIFLAFQLPLQAHPEVRRFHHNRDDYEAIVQDWNESSVSSQTSANYSRPCNLIPLKIENREYCILIEDDGLVFFLDNPRLVIIYREERLNTIYPCDEILSYLEDSWILCRPPIR